MTANPRCKTCGKTEQQCAYSYPCCDRCIAHYPGLDADGNDKPHGNTKQDAA